VTAGLNTITVAERALLLVATNGAQTHLAAVSGDEDRRPAVDPTRFANSTDALAGYDLDALVDPRWSPWALCGREWNAMSPGEGGTWLPWQEVSLVPTCRACLRVIDSWLPVASTPTGIDLLASIVADRVESLGYARVLGAPAEQVEALRRIVRKHLRSRGYRSETHHVNGVVHVFSEDAHAAIDPDVHAAREHEMTARIAKLLAGAKPEPARIEDQPDVISWSTWITDL
jgi:hypothetical protein